MLNLVNGSDEDELSILTDKLAKTITSEVRDISVDKSRYNVRITKEDISKSVSSTLMDLLGKLSANMDYTLPALLIGNIVTGIISNNPTNLQIALGNLIRDSKSLINQMYQFGVTCSYDEILRLKKSAALAATNDIQLSGIHEGDGGLIQTLVDNFDADISSQNGKLTTHSLAMLITQPCTQPDENQNIPSTIPRVSKADMSQQTDFELPIQRYQGPKKVPMPDNCSKKFVPPLKVLCSCIIAKERADFLFMSEINSNDNCPEFNGFNTSVAREQDRL